jgi:superfamily II DNA or RNA helicase
MSKDFRYYQEEADLAIYNELNINNKCIVKMFCGTGKSLLMRKCKIIQNKMLVVFVFPSLSLIEQFFEDYLYDFPSENILKISSEKEATTNPIKIQAFLSKNTPKIICITYQSFNTLIDNLGEIKINVSVFDEAHHAVGEVYQKLIFENNVCEKQIFFTATPKNANGIIMYDRKNLDTGMCGNLVYDYSYLRGMNEDYLNPFEICIDMYTENTNKSVYESIARNVLKSGNSRILTFHSDVNTDRDTSVNNFVNEKAFKIIFHEICKKEFPKLNKKYKKISMIGLSSSISGKERIKILNKFDTTEDNEVMVISSCETIGEGIDTKNANMCVFVDPKSSFVKIIQNTGRIVRKIFGFDKPKSTILIPCWVDKNKYLECNGDREKCDEVIREEMNKGGNFNGILNVLSALKQEDEDLYDICLHYPDTYSPQEIKSNLEKQGYIIDVQVGEGTLLETVEHLIDDEIDYDNYEECENDEEIIMQIAEDNNVCIEIHTNSLENPIETYNSECESSDVIRLYKSIDDESEEEIYLPIIKKNSMKRNRDSISGLKRENRLNVNVHTNPDIKVLWNVISDFDITKDICSCVIDCEIIDSWYHRFEEIKHFIDENKQRPSRKSNIETEKFLGGWFDHNQQNYKNKEKGMKDENRYKLWTLFLEEYKEYFKNNDEIWYETFENVKQFIKKNKEKPSLEKSQNEIEKTLARWIYNQQKNYKSKKYCMQDENRYKLWTLFLEEYKEYFKDNDEIWIKKFENLKKFIDENKCKPSPEISINKDERILGQWLSQQIQKYKQKKHSMLDENKYKLWSEFLEKYKEYFKDNDKSWYKNLENVKDFIKKNKKRPSHHIGNETEKFLGRWLLNQQKNYKNKEQCMKDENRYKLWTLFLEEYKDYFMDNDEKWYENIENVKYFISEKKKRPSAHSHDESEKFLGGWIGTQLKSYKNKTQCMSIKLENKSRRQTWEEFIENNPLYFKNIVLEKDLTNNICEEEIPVITTPKKKSMKLNNSSAKKKETPEQKRQRIQSEISQLHKKYKTMKSENLSKEFNENPDLWNTYHQISEENEKSFPEDEIPRNRIIQELNKIKTKRSKKIVDMGCGKAQISKYFQNDKKFEFINYDHISSEETVIPCDISKLPLEDDSVEICILSLAMWGSNCREYIKQSHRVLESNGQLFIIEPTKRWSEQDENGNIIPEKEACKMKSLLQENGFQIIEENIEKFSLFICIKV